MLSLLSSHLSNALQGGEAWPLKDAELALRNREDGNAAFQSGNHELALVLYTEAMRYSPVHPTTHEGEDFAAAAANRSAALMALGKFEECLEDVQLAIEGGYSPAASYKLYIRQDFVHGILYTNAHTSMEELFFCANTLEYKTLLGFWGLQRCWRSQSLISSQDQSGQ